MTDNTPDNQEMPNDEPLEEPWETPPAEDDAPAEELQGYSDSEEYSEVENDALAESELFLEADTDFVLVEEADFVLVEESVATLTTSDEEDNALMSPDEDMVSVVEYQIVPAPQFEDLSLTRAIGLAIFRPLKTLPALLKVTVDSEAYPDAEESTGESHHLNLESPEWVERLSLGQFFNFTHLRRVGWLFLILLPMMHGANVLYGIATNPTLKATKDIGDSDFWLGIGIFTAVIALLFETRERWLYPMLAQMDTEKFKVAPSQALVASEAVPLLSAGTPPEDVEKDDHLNTFERLLEWSLRHSLRLMLILPAIVLTYYAYEKVAVRDARGEITAVYFTKEGLQSWVGAILCWYLIFLVDLNGIFLHLIGRKRFPIEEWKLLYQKTARWRWTYTVLVLILILGGYFRLHNLDGVPPAMTSDQMEKLLDAIKIDDGNYAVFFPNNGGREAFQMYYVKVLATTLGMGFDFRTLKYASISEGMLAIVLLYAMVKTVIGRFTKERDQLGDWVGLASAGLLAVSSWHVMISRLGLRIGLTPIAVMLATIFVVRAVRFNRRSDFIHLGLVLGFGMYWYQADRMLPLVMIPVVGLAALFGLPRFKQLTWRYVLQFAMTGIIALVIYLPMYHYSKAFPDQFWNRTYGRLFSGGTYDFCEYIGTTTTPLVCKPTTEQLVDHFYSHRAKLWDNYKDAFLMFAWEGDPAWFQNAQGNPAMDSTTNALLMLGALLWLFYMIWRREVALLVVPFGIVFMMLPSTLTIASILNENPSFTRLSGLIPFAFMIAGFPLGLLGYEIVKAGRTRVVAYLVALLVLGLFIRHAAYPNYDNYFEDYRISYDKGWKPYDEISIPLRNFAEREGSFGNAFYVHSPHWLDHRILGSMAGDFGWPNTLDPREKVYEQMRENNGTPYQYDATKPLLFYIDPKDSASIDYFQKRFPGGHLEYITARNGNDFYIYTTPADWGWIGAYATEQTAHSACISMCRFIH